MWYCSWFIWMVFFLFISLPTKWFVTHNTKNDTIDYTLTLILIEWIFTGNWASRTHKNNTRAQIITIVLFKTCSFTAAGYYCCWSNKNKYKKKNNLWIWDRTTILYRHLLLFKNGKYCFFLWESTNKMLKLFSFNKIIRINDDDATARIQCV